MVVHCRSLAAHGACLPTATSRSSTTALLLRLLGLASQDFCRPLAVSALLAAGSVCDFGSPRRDDCLAAMVEVVPACEGLVRNEVFTALNGIMTGHGDHALTVSGALDVTLTLVEAAALHNGSAPRPMQSRSWLNITGPCSWLLLDSWMFRAAMGSLMDAFDMAENSDVASAGSVQRKAVLAVLAARSHRVRL